MSESSLHIINNRLSIFILQDGFSFLVTSDYSQSPLFFESFRTDVVGSTSELLKRLKSKIDSGFLTEYQINLLEVIYGTPQFGIVPHAYFDESLLPHYLKYSSKLIEGDDFSYDEITSIQANTVYIPYINVNNYLFEKFGSFNYTHAFTRLIESAFTKSFSFKEYVKVFVSDHMIFLTAFRDQKLLLTNTFSFETPEDFAYYILFSFEELKLDREELTLDFTGNFLKTDENKALNILSNYIRHIAFSNKGEILGLSNKEGFNAHFNLI